MLLNALKAMIMVLCLWTAVPGFSNEEEPFNEDPSNKRYTIAFTGDVMLGRLVNKNMQQMGASYPLGNVSSLLASADLALINLECVISSKGEKWMNPPRRFYFRADPIALEVLENAGIDYVTLANNHVLDFGYEALNETFRHLEEKKIKWAGAGRNIHEAMQPAILRSGDLSIAVFGATDNYPKYAAGESSSGTWHFKIPLPEEGLKDLEKKIQGLHNEGVDLVVFSLHWGPNMLEHPPEHFQRFAHRLVDLGVDIVHGHSAHVFQGIEIYKGGIIFYDTGDFVDDYYVSQNIDEQFLYLVHVEKGTLKKIELIPVHISHYQVNLSDDETAKRTIQRMRERSRPFGTQIISKQGKAWIPIRKRDR